MQSTVKSGLLLLSIVYITACCARPNEMALFREHFQRVNKLQCGQPQPRVVELKDIISKDEWDKKYEDVKELITPPVTVLNRCYSSGCCENRSERCMPMETEEVKLTFAIMHDSFIEYFETTAKNHLQCGCLETNESNIK